MKKMKSILFCIGILIIGNQSLKGQCQIDYTFWNYSYPNTLSYTFSLVNISQTPFQSITWDFGDGTIVTGGNPMHTYSTYGVYNACVMVTDTSGFCTTDTVCKSLNIGPQTPCHTTFTSTYNGGLNYSFNSTVSGVGPITYQWDFGDGNTSSLPNPTHTYATQNSYLVSLKTTDSLGCIKIPMDTLDFILSTQSELEGTSFVLYPNPTNDKVNIILQNTSSSYNVNVLNPQGQIITSKVFQNSRNIITLPKEKGIYFIQLTLENGKTINRKVIKY